MNHDQPDLPVLETGTYRHTKSGKQYEVIGVALETESSEPLVIYKPLYESPYQLFARPYAMFTEHVTISGVTAARFTKVED